MPSPRLPYPQPDTIELLLIKTRQQVKVCIQERLCDLNDLAKEKDIYVAKVRYLTSLINMKGSMQPGGPYTSFNIMDNIMQTEAIQLLNELV